MCSSPQLKSTPSYCKMRRGASRLSRRTADERRRGLLGYVCCLVHRGVFNESPAWGCKLSRSRKMHIEVTPDQFTENTAGCADAQYKGVVPGCTLSALIIELYGDFRPYTATFYTEEYAANFHTSNLFCNSRWRSPEARGSFGPRPGIAARAPRAGVVS